MSRAAELRARRDSLLLRSEALRRRLQNNGDALEHALGRVERGVSLARTLTARPVVLAAGASLLLALGPRRALGWLSRGLLVTSLVKRAYGLFRQYRAVPQAQPQPQSEPQPPTPLLF